MLEFTLLGYCLRRSSFELRVARVALSPAKRHHQQCLRGPLSGPELNVVSGRGGRNHDDPTLRERPKENQCSRRVGDYESDHFRPYTQHNPQLQPPLPDTTFSSGPDNGPRRHSWRCRLAGESAPCATYNLKEERRWQ